MKRLLLAGMVAAVAHAETLNETAQRMLAARRRTVEQIRTIDQAKERQNFVRTKVLELIGGLPSYKGPLAPRTTGTLDRGGYVIEKVMFQSLPDFWVTANVYRPARPGRYPAVLMPMGHWEQGKAAAQRIAANLALKGFVAMPYDPIGQGERDQAWDARLQHSMIGGATDQHFLAGAQAILVGQSFARYRIWDGMRGIDYLTSRADVDGSRVGVTGCSGGGTLTTYIAALDDRVKVAAPSCYMNSFETLFAGPVGDSEQSLTGFLSSGLDQTDYVEAFAPKPWLINSTEGDFFTPAGARIVYEDALAWYKMFGVPERIQWTVGPGGHGTPLKVREAIYTWMIRWLRNGDGDPKEVAVETLPNFDLYVAGGHAPGREVWQVIAETPLSHGTGEELRQAARAWVEAGGAVTGVSENAPERGFVGGWETSTRALLVGRNLPGIRAAAMLREHKPGTPLEASGSAGVAALIAAAADPAIPKVKLVKTPYSLRAALKGPITRGLYEAAIPGFALKWDLDDLVALIGRDRVEWVDPTDWNGNVVKLEGAIYKYTSADANQER